MESPTPAKSEAPVINKSAVQEKRDDEGQPPVKPSFWDSYDKKVKEIRKSTPSASTGLMIKLQRYDKMVYFKRNQDPLKWWKNNQAIFFRLSVFAQQIQ